MNNYGSIQINIKSMNKWDQSGSMMMFMDESSQLGEAVNQASRVGCPPPWTARPGVEFATGFAGPPEETARSYGGKK